MLKSDLTVNHALMFVTHAAILQIVVSPATLAGSSTTIIAMMECALKAPMLTQATRTVCPVRMTALLVVDPLLSVPSAQALLI